MSRWLLVVPVVLYAACVFPFVYRDVLGEPDLERMAMAILYGASSGLNETAGNHYNYLVSFGYYAAFYHLLPHAILVNSSALIATINNVGFCSAVVAIGMLAGYAERIFGTLAAVGICMVFAFSPVYLDLGTSGHPQLPGFALLMAGAWVLTFATDAQTGATARTGSTVGAVILFVAAMCVRADVALAFPFITLLGREVGMTSRSAWIRAAALRLVLLTLVCAVWAVIASSGFHDTASADKGGFVRNFFATFYLLHNVPRGLLVFVLCLGVATTLALIVVPFPRAVRAPHRVTLAALALLALPTLLFWLPNSTPGRHLLLAYLAAAILVSLLLTRALRPAQALAICALLPVANQVIAEMTHGPIERHYQWAYPLLTARRATTSIPMGAFPLDHEAKQQSFAVLRNEGREFARACSGQVLVLSEEPHFMLMSLIELDPTVRLNNFSQGGPPNQGVTRVIRAHGTRCSADFVDKQASSGRDAARDFMDSPAYATWPVYFQEARRNRYDRTPIPASRRFCAGVVAERGCPRPASSG
jgi:hypothetical protein